MKCQSVRFELVGIDRRVLDPAAPTGVRPKPPLPTGGVSVVPNAVVATAAIRLDAERRARTSVLEQERGFATAGLAARALVASAVIVEPLPADTRQKVLAEVDKELVEAGLLDQAGAVTEEAKKRYGWEREVLLPTPGVVVKGCLDECDVCEPELKKKIDLELKLLERQIELLEKSQEYRCCPDGAEEEGGET
ncbi:MAG TPA: hypothetical protein VI540_03745 [Gaiellaceae bacterium]|nr:hypothetical protein [Gaiellaceae bacterium]